MFLAGPQQCEITVDLIGDGQASSLTKCSHCEGSCGHVQEDDGLQYTIILVLCDPNLFFGSRSRPYTPGSITVSPLSTTTSLMMGSWIDYATRSTSQTASTRDHGTLAWTQISDWPSSSYPDQHLLIECRRNSLMWFCSNFFCFTCFNLLLHWHAQSYHMGNKCVVAVLQWVAYCKISSRQCLDAATCNFLLTMMLIFDRTKPTAVQHASVVTFPQIEFTLVQLACSASLKVVYFVHIWNVTELCSQAPCCRFHCWTKMFEDCVIPFCLHLEHCLLLVAN